MTPKQKLADLILRDLGFEERAKTAGYKDEEIKEMIQAAKEIMIPEKAPKVAIVVSGGVVQSAYSDNPSVEIDLIDCDNIEEENPDADCDKIIAQKCGSLTPVF